MAENVLHFVVLSWNNNDHGYLKNLLGTDSNIKIRNTEIKQFTIRIPVY